MPDWTRSMQQTYSFYEVNPGTWGDVKKLDFITSGNIERDADSDTMGSASFSSKEDFNDKYIRVYLDTIQNDIEERECLGTFLVQTPGMKFDGKTEERNSTGYTPLIELKEKPMPIGYSLLKQTPIMSTAGAILKTNMRAPVIDMDTDTTLQFDFVANSDDTWLSFVRDLISNDGYKLDMDSYGKVMFAPYQKLEAMQPIWTYDDSNSSILYPNIEIKNDLFGIPNVVEVVYSYPDKFGTITENYARVVNDDPNSPLSTVNRGREIIYRDTEPSLFGSPGAEDIEIYAEKLLEQLSTIEYEVTYEHGYCPVRVGDCVRLNYGRSGLQNIRAKVVSQSIELGTGCKVSETAIFTNKLWEKSND